ncbi:hypothetical protein Hanom_Chr07g00610741 [Helianthus anomalus]
MINGYKGSLHSPTHNELLSLAETVLTDPFQRRRLNGPMNIESPFKSKIHTNQSKKQTINNQRHKKDEEKIPRE